MDIRYKAVLHRGVADILLSFPTRSRQQLFSILDRLESESGQQGDIMEFDDTGRTNHILISGAWAITYWPDHAAKEIRIVRIEKA